VSDEKPKDTARDTAGQEPTDPATDVGQIDAAELEERAFPASLASEYRVVIADEAFQAIKTHAQSDTSIELCGVLAGSVYRDEDGPFLVVERAIAGVATRRTGSQVTFTHETWDRIHQQMEEQCPDLRIVGWYHTHPGFGIFLSEMDQFIQDNFFDLPHQVAFVYDPVSERRGLFVWKGGTSSRLRRYWLGGELVYDEEGGPASEPGARSLRTTSTAGRLGGPTRRPSRSSRSSRGPSCGSSAPSSPSIWPSGSAASSRALPPSSQASRRRTSRR